MEEDNTFQNKYLDAPVGYLEKRLHLPKPYSETGYLSYISFEGKYSSLLETMRFFPGENSIVVLSVFDTFGVELPAIIDLKFGRENISLYLKSLVKRLDDVELDISSEEFPNDDVQSRIENVVDILDKFDPKSTTPPKFENVKDVLITMLTTGKLYFYNVGDVDILREKIRTLTRDEHSTLKVFERYP